MTTDYTIGSGNVYEDLGFPNPEEMQIKSQLVREITAILTRRKLSQKQAAELLGVDAAKICAILKGKFSGYSIERLFRFLQLLDQEIVIQLRSIRSKKRAANPVRVIRATTAQQA